MSTVLVALAAGMATGQVRRTHVASHVDMHVKHVYNKKACSFALRLMRTSVYM